MSRAKFTLGKKLTSLCFSDVASEVGQSGGVSHVNVDGMSVAERNFRLEFESG